MERTICVKGTGSLSAKADLIVVNLTVTNEDKEYDETLSGASAKVSILNGALQSIGFENDDLKTLKFDISADYDSEKDRYGNYRQVFRGYECEYRLKLSFDFESKRLGEVLKAIAECGADAETRFNFTVKDRAKVSEALLASAAENAREKAEILCRASGVNLGELLNIDYSWGIIDIRSDSDITAYGLGLGIMETPDFMPDDIDLEDTATFVWEIK